ncbi:hypothetical protein GKQ77_18440 [Streptomyces sp. BG9H]|uniref:Integral membrane protein n=1 Tax=Streptomyces anatolicus TaxID=2675858 RepID=A0ABS6YQ05_9ACTN|nr:ABC transporter permease [Streptomyces anatolicus]MBW5423515.1 hypothetical protein [Streptomyces anatolicus]
MTSRLTGFGVMLGSMVVSHLRNRLAMALALFFLPLWIVLVRVSAYSSVRPFSVKAAGLRELLDSNQVAQLAGMLNAVTTVTGFMMFMVTIKAREMDRRLVLAGCSRLELLGARFSSLVVVATVLSLYTALLLHLSLPVQQFWWLAGSLLAANVTYGAFGLMLGSLLRGELEGFFVVIMVSLVDAGMQNPTVKVVDLPGLDVLPLHGALQSALAATFTPVAPGGYTARTLLWCAGAAAVALAAFCLRTRSYGTVLQTPSDRQERSTVALFP